MGIEQDAKSHTWRARCDECQAYCPKTGHSAAEAMGQACLLGWWHGTIDPTYLMCPGCQDQEVRLADGLGDAAEDDSAIRLGDEPEGTP